MKLSCSVIAAFVFACTSTGLWAGHHEEDAHAAHAGHAAHEMPSAEEALHRLQEGNARYVHGHMEHGHVNSERRTELASGQAPFAVVLACADSRVAPELVFDQGLGDIFVIRVAGNVVDPHVLGSIEYAVDHLGTNLIVVLGHERCGAVTAARDTLAAHGHAPGNLQSLVDSIAPAVKATEGKDLETTIHANVDHVVAEMKAESETLGAKSSGHGPLHIVGAYYDLDTGEVAFADGDQHCGH